MIDVKRYVECFECGSTENIHQHHVVPQSKGGTKTIPLCNNCHSVVHDAPFLKKIKSKKKKPYYPVGSVEHKILQMEGIQKARLAGKYTGRKFGSVETKEKFQQKSKTKDIIKDLRDGCTVREISTKRKCSFGTIIKIKKMIQW